MEDEARKHWRGVEQPKDLWSCNTQKNSRKLGARLLLAGRIDAFDTVEPENNCFEHVRDGFSLLALKLTEHASQLHYGLLAH